MCREVPECREVLRLLEAGKIDHEMLAGISEKVALTFDDLECVLELHFHGKLHKSESL